MDDLSDIANQPHSSARRVFMVASAFRRGVNDARHVFYSDDRRREMIQEMHDIASSIVQEAADLGLVNTAILEQRASYLGENTTTEVRVGTDRFSGRSHVYAVITDGKKILDAFNYWDNLLGHIVNNAGRVAWQEKHPKAQPSKRLTRPYGQSEWQVHLG